MAAVTMAEVGDPAATRRIDKPLVVDKLVSHVLPELKRGLEALAEAHRFARDLNASLWDFAVEISELRRWRISNSGLRWLVLGGFAEHGIETTRSDSPKRTFRHPHRMLFGRRSCFVITERGAEQAQEIELAGLGRQAGKHVASTSVGNSVRNEDPREAPLPKWDRNRHELMLGSTVVTRFKMPAAGPEAILTVFEESGWPQHIEDPLSPAGAQVPSLPLYDAVQCLNKTQKQPVLRFLADSANLGVRWELYSQLASDHADGDT
jgi:hypothetical protein